MNKTATTYVIVALALAVGLAGFLIALSWRQSRGDVAPASISSGVAVQREGLAELEAGLRATMESTPSQVMTRSGLAGAMGGARVRLSSGKPQEIMMPVPQLADGQIPICFFISSTPADAVTEYRLRTREEGNVVIGICLAGGDEEVRIAWSSVVLLAPCAVIPNATSADAYRAANPCVQADADEIKELAALTWASSSGATEFADGIQRHIREMARREQPRSLDAVAILRSGENGICTGNANLAAALMRAKGIACRSIATIPTISQEVEMHRIVEFSEGGRWLAFDPSSVQRDVPAKAWQNIIMAKTTIGDERLAMKSRPAAMAGCPYGQELELLTSGVALCGQDFFWTMAKPLAAFEPTHEAIRLAVADWNRYLTTGALTQAQLNASSAATTTEFAERLRDEDGAID
ncbi:MAG TPA: transglutaminase-like domain-containing protein [Thermoleophilia bacterium]|nr:transglutaminase-like domain-containing protein [Thermoleophilia bacterium]